jgi:hypothetical protein
MIDTNLDDFVASIQGGYKTVNRAQEPLGVDDGQPQSQSVLHTRPSFRARLGRALWWLTCSSSSTTGRSSSLPPSLRIYRIFHNASPWLVCLIAQRATFPRTRIGCHDLRFEASLLHGYACTSQKLARDILTCRFEGST